MPSKSGNRTRIQTPIEGNIWNVFIFSNLSKIDARPFGHAYNIHELMPEFLCVVFTLELNEIFSYEMRSNSY